MRKGFVFTVIALLGYALTGVRQVKPGERAVVFRFGRVVEQPLPGLHVGLPMGMDRVEIVPVDMIRRVRVGFTPESEEDESVLPLGQLLTGDHNLVNVQVLVDYAVDESQVVDYVVESARVEGVIARTVETVLAEWIGGRDVDEVLIDGKAVLPSLLAARTQKRVNPYRLGVKIQGASISYLYPPDEVKLAFDEVTRAQATIRTREHEARQDAERRRREAETQKHQLERSTAAFQREQAVMAVSEAESFTKRLDQYHRLRKKNPDFLAGIWWNEMSKLFARLKQNGQIDLLDHHLGADGLDIIVAPPIPGKK